MPTKRTIAQQRDDLQRRYQTVVDERDEAREQNTSDRFTIKHLVEQVEELQVAPARLEVQVALLGESLRRLLLAYCALGRVRDTSRPAPVYDTGTPGVEVTPR
jgi:predicted nuclease with TOPRIM domain